MKKEPDVTHTDDYLRRLECALEKLKELEAQDDNTRGNQNIEKWKAHLELYGVDNELNEGECE